MSARDLTRSLAAAARLALDGHVAESGAFSVTVTDDEVRMQGSDTTAMRATAVRLGMAAGYRRRADHNVWRGTVHGIAVELVASGEPLDAPAYTDGGLTDTGALHAIATPEDTTCKRSA